MYEQKPWLKFYGMSRKHRLSAGDDVRGADADGARNPDAIAYDFFGYTSTYRQFGPKSTAAPMPWPRSA